MRKHEPPWGPHYGKSTMGRIREHSFCDYILTYNSDFAEKSDLRKLYQGTFVGSFLKYDMTRFIFGAHLDKCKGVLKFVVYGNYYFF